MKRMLYIILMMAVPQAIAWDDNPIPLPDLCPTCLNSSGGVMRNISSGSNYHTRIKGAKDLQLENPAELECGLQVILVRENGNHDIRFLMLKPGQSRVVTAEEFEGAREVYVISLQPFKAYNSADRGLGDALNVVRPSQRDLSLVRVAIPSGGEAIVGIDGENNVHHAVYGQIIGSWDGAETVTQTNGSELQIVRR